MNERSSTDKPLLEESLTYQVIGAFYTVHSALGFGFLESVYRRALVHELTLRGIAVESEVNVDVWYKGVRVGHFRADELVERKLVVETKAGAGRVEADWKQLVNYLRGTDLEVGLLLHFGQKATHKRVIFSNDRKSERAQRS